MPTYEYQCTACGHTFELFQSIKAAPIKKCPNCGKSKAKRLIGMGAGLLFKGSGFYITDYRGEAYNKAAKADAPQSGGGESSGGGDAKPATDAATPAKTETKAESKPDAKPTATAATSKKPQAKTPPKKS